MAHATNHENPLANATRALGKYIYMMTGKEHAIRVEIADFNVPDARLDDAYSIDVACGKGAILATNPRAALIAENRDYGLIVCRCEEISKGEILDALRCEIPCTTIDGVKRRVRPGMGRCQGGFCGPLVLDIIAKEKNLTPRQVRKSGFGSELLLGAAKEENKDGV